MRSLGCRDAIALDGGSSSAMFYRGRFAARPHRSLTNLLVVYDSSVDYQRALGRLAPGVALARRPSRTRGLGRGLLPVDAPMPADGGEALAQRLQPPITRPT